MLMCQFQSKPQHLFACMVSGIFVASDNESDFCSLYDVTIFINVICSIENLLDKNIFALCEWKQKIFVRDDNDICRRSSIKVSLSLFIEYFCVPQHSIELHLV